MDNISKIVKAIQKINPTAQFSFSGEDLNTLTWENGTQPISITDIQKQIPIVEQEFTNKQSEDLANKQSALNKLKALGLNDAEINSILGK
jgi:hypothetical protein